MSLPLLTWRALKVGDQDGFKRDDFYRGQSLDGAWRYVGERFQARCARGRGMGQGSVEGGL